MAKHKRNSSVLYLLVADGSERFFLAHLIALAERWAAETPRRVSWSSIAVDVPVGYIGDALKVGRKDYPKPGEIVLDWTVGELAPGKVHTIVLYVDARSSS